MTLPAEEGVGFERQQGILPVFDATREEDEPQAIDLRKGRLFDLTVQDDQLLPKKGILSDQFGFAARQVGSCAESNRIARGVGGSVMV